MSPPLKTESCQRCSLHCSGSNACRDKGMLPGKAAPFLPLNPTEPNLQEDQMSWNYFISETIHCSALPPFQELQEMVLNNANTLPIPTNHAFTVPPTKGKYAWECLTVHLAELTQQGNEARRQRESFFIWPVWLTPALAQCPVSAAVFWSTELWTQLHQALHISGGKEVHQWPQSWTPHTTYLLCNFNIKDLTLWGGLGVQVHQEKERHFLLAPPALHPHIWIPLLH